MWCVYCARGVDDISASASNKAKSIKGHETEILFVDSLNRLCCPRCVSNLYLVLKYDGRSVVRHIVKSNKWLWSKKLVEQADDTLVEDETIQQEESLINRSKKGLRKREERQKEKAV